MSDLLNSASLVMIPSGYKEDVVYSQIPTDGSGDLSFTRASNGTRVNSAGLVEVCPWNLLQQSETFDNAAWTKTSTTITSNSAVAPNGTTTADKIECSTNSPSTSFIRQAITVGSGSQNTFSIYIKPITDTSLRIDEGAYTGKNITFNLSTGNITTTGGPFSNYSIITLANGWFQCVFAFQYSAGQDLWYFNINNQSAYIWGAQLNIGSTAKPYFPTTDRLNVPRLTYQNGGGGCPSLLLEKQSTNLTLYSEQLDNAVHYNLGFTISPNNITSPDGTQNADKFTETTGTGEHVVYDIDSNATGTYTLSAFFKGGAGTIYPVLRLNGSTTTEYAGCIFNTSTGAVVNTFYNTYSAPTTKVENMGNGWYRVSMTTTTTNANFGMRIAASNSTSPSVGAYGAISYTGNTSNYFYAYGAQLEASSYATSYIQTTSSWATRVKDVCYKNSISSLIGQSSGVVFADIVPFQFLDGSYIGISDNASTSNRQIFGFEADSGNSGTLRFYGFYTGSSITCTAGQRYKIAMAYANNDFVIYINGTQVVNQTSGTVTGTLSHFGFDSWVANSQNFQGQVNEAILFPTRLTNAELASLTTI